MRNGKQVAFDLNLPGDVYFLVSQSEGYEFYAKHGIATVLQNALSQSNHKSRTTDQSSQM